MMMPRKAAGRQHVQFARRRPEAFRARPPMTRAPLPTIIALMDHPCLKKRKKTFVSKSPGAEHFHAVFDGLIDEVRICDVVQVGCGKDGTMISSNEGEGAAAGYQDREVITELSRELIGELREAARQAAGRAYAPFSHFHVGAAVLGEDGSIYTGCNVENASFGLTMCAERNAVGSAVSGGVRRFKAVAIYTPTTSLNYPCGACRQVLHEFGRDLEVHVFNQESDHSVQRLDQLLPEGFGFTPEKS